MKRISTFFFILLCLVSINAREVDNPVARDGATVRFSYMRFTVLTPQLIRMEYSRKRVFEDRATFTVVNRNLPIPTYTYKVENGYFYLYTDSITVRYKTGTLPSLNDKSPDNLSITFKMNHQDATWYPGKDDALNLKGTTRTLDGASGDSKRAEMENGVVSRAGWSLLDESPSVKRGDGSQSFAFKQNNYTGMDWLEQPADINATDWYFCGYGHNYKKALGDYVKIAGRIPMPPAYIFGYWYSRYYRYSAQDFMDIVNDVEKNDIPMDVMIIDKDWHINDWTGWSWNKELFPDPKGLIDWMHQHGLKVSLNIHPADGVNNNEDNFSLLCKDLGLNASTTTNIPWKLTDTTFYKAFFKDIIRLRESEGVDFWWLDWQQWLTDKDVAGLGETFWCNHVFYEDMRLNRTDHRPVIFHRWGGLGSHRYQIGFSGDSWANFQTLAFEPYFTSTASNVCYGYWGHDLGGHQQSGDNDPELYLRWIQYGVFSPIFRTHATNATNIERRIWKFPNFPLMREAVRLRYKLFPYIYTAAREAYDTGISICRPLYYDYPEETNAYDYENEYMFGNDIFVSPIVTRSGSDQTTKHSIWLPDGKWWNVCRSTLINGNVTFTDNYAQNEIPYFYKAGSIITNYPIQRSVTIRPDTIILKIVPGANGQTSLYEDEGDTEGYKDSIFTLTPISQERGENTVTLKIGARTGFFPGMPTQRSYRMEFLGQQRPLGVNVNDKNVDNWTYNEITKTISVTVPTTSCSSSIKVQIQSAEVPVASVTPEKQDTDFTGGVERNQKISIYWITGSAVPGGIQQLQNFPNSQYKFAGTLHPGDLKIINTKGITQNTNYLAPSTEDANIINKGTAFTTSTNNTGNGWTVSYPGTQYKFTVDINTKTVSGEYGIPWSELFLVGGCAECGWTEGKMLPFTCSETNPYLWTWTGVLKSRSENVEPKRFKLMGQNSWSPKSIHPYTQDENALTSSQFIFDGDDNKWQIGNDGFYKITINLLTEAFKAEYLGTETGIKPIDLENNVQITSAYHTIMVRSSEKVQVKIYNEAGQLLATDGSTNVAINMDCSGFYLVKVNGSSIHTSKKIMLP
jgi:alpha-glucosidase (family GH31 glycosyl hydrolase)